MSHKAVQDITELVLKINDLDFDISNFDIYDTLRESSHSIWETHHEALLEALRVLEPEGDTDFQLFWFECLGHPDIIPNRYSKSKKKYMGLSGRLPATIEESLSAIGGFHDLNINHMTYSGSRVEMLLDNRYKGTKSEIDYQIKLIFEGVESPICAGEFSGSQILSAEEIPMIGSAFDIIGIDRRLYIQGKRLMKFELIDLNGGHNELLILFKNWSSF